MITLEMIFRFDNNFVRGMVRALQRRIDLRTAWSVTLYCGIQIFIHSMLALLLALDNATLLDSLLSPVDKLNGVAL